ncbi:MAG: HEPN domain-containing protein [Bacteroidales bacterium]|nr:HEPN domain-containing protein [Bacteroidales bacterium]
MKEMEEDWTAFVRYRIEKADETYLAAQVLYEAAQWNSVVNRLYYSCFYVASALLLHRHITAKSHAGIIGQFSENVVRTGEISIDDFRVYSKLLNWRTKGDYSDLYDFTQEDVDMVMKPARVFINRVKELIVLP